jgi:hypothetical protein
MNSAFSVFFFVPVLVPQPIVDSSNATGLFVPFQNLKPEGEGADNTDTVNLSVMD